MSINIKNREAATLLAELKAATGKGASQIVLELLRGETERQRRLADIERRRASIEAIVRESSRRFPPDAPGIDEIIGYDEHGLPR